MRRAALAASLLLIGIGAARAIGDPAEMLPDPAQEARAEHVGRQLRCLVCQNESIEDSGADLARDLRQIVRQRVAAGNTDPQVIAWMVARYGQFVRLRPALSGATLLLWGAPILALCVSVLATWMGGRHRPDPPAPLSVDERARVAALLRPPT